MDLVPPHAKKHLFRLYFGKIFLSALKFDDNQEEDSSKSCPNIRIQVFLSEEELIPPGGTCSEILLKAKVEHVPLSIKICLFGHWILFSMQNSLILRENWWLEKGISFWKHQDMPFLSEAEVEHVPPLLLEERVELIPPEAKVEHVSPH